MVNSAKRQRRPQAPKAPKKGQVFFVQTGSHWSIGNNYSIRKVSSKSFFVYSNGKLTRYLLSEWNQWLIDRFTEGVLHHNGLALQPPPSVQAFTPPQSQSTDDEARDQRFLRATRSVQNKYKFIREDDDEQSVHFDVHGGQQIYRISVPRTNGGRLSCSCPDARRNAQTNQLLCKHLIAVLMSNQDLRFHLLDTLL